MEGLEAPLVLVLLGCGLRTSNRDHTFALGQPMEGFSDIHLSEPESQVGATTWQMNDNMRQLQSHMCRSTGDKQVVSSECYLLKSA